MQTGSVELCGLLDISHTVFMEKYYILKADVKEHPYLISSEEFGEEDNIHLRKVGGLLLVLILAMMTRTDLTDKALAIVKEKERFV